MTLRRNVVTVSYKQIYGSGTKKAGTREIEANYIFPPFLLNFDVRISIYFRYRRNWLFFEKVVSGMPDKMKRDRSFPIPH